MLTLPERPIGALTARGEETTPVSRPDLGIPEAEPLTAADLRARIGAPSVQTPLAPAGPLGQEMLAREAHPIIQAAARGESWVTPELLTKHFANEDLVNATKGTGDCRRGHRQARGTGRESIEHRKPPARRRGEHPEGARSADEHDDLRGPAYALGHDRACRQRPVAPRPARRIAPRGRTSRSGHPARSNWRNQWHRNTVRDCYDTCDAF